MRRLNNTTQTKFVRHTAAYILLGSRRN